MSKLQQQILYTTIAGVVAAVVVYQIKKRTSGVVGD